jgi:hypothetical protein
MNKLALTSCLVLTAVLMSAYPAAGGGLEPNIEEGDTRPFVIEVLGEPAGSMGGGEYEILYFERGKVVLESGKVKSADLISQEAADRRRVARLKEQQERQQAADSALSRGGVSGDGASKEASTAKSTSAETAPAQSKPAKAGKAAEPPKSVDDLSDEQKAELNKRIAEGIDTPPIKMSKRKLRRYRRGRSPSQLAQREQQITDAYLQELQAGQAR